LFVCKLFYRLPITIENLQKLQLPLNNNSNVLNYLLQQTPETSQLHLLPQNYQKLVEILEKEKIDAILKEAHQVLEKTSNKQDMMEIKGLSGRLYKLGNN